METQKICPNCRKPLPPDVPLGLCPECLIKSGFPTEGGTGASGEAAGARFVPPPVEEIIQLFPQLEILGYVGKGGMGAVYKARQPTLDRLVALKVLPPAVASDSGFAERFNREARALARLSHPNIVAVHDFGKAGPLHYLLMEFMDGTNLREVEQAGKLSPQQALTIVPKICEALQYAHDQGVVHRDIKPENILLDKQGRVKIADFGIAKMVGQEPKDVSLTGAKDVVGTPHYMAPEQIEKPQTVDHRADIYSLGVVFYEMLTGELPLGKFAPPSKKVLVDVRLDEVVLHTLEKEPSRRYQQASQVKTDVETITGTPQSAARAASASPFSVPVEHADSDKALLPAFLLALFFGVFGAHRFYVGRIWTALLQLGAWAGCALLIIACATTGGTYQPTLGILLGVTMFGCIIWATVDWLLILCKAFNDGRGRRITNWLHSKPGEPRTDAGAIAGPPTIPPAGKIAAPAAGGASPPPPMPQKSSASGAGMIVAPAVGLMIAAIWKLLSAFMALFFLAGWLSDQWLGTLKDFDIGSFSHWGDLAGFSIVLFKVIPALLILIGAVQMLRLRSYAWSIAASILAIVACSLIGLPMGIWALIVLAREDVRETFANATRAHSTKTILWPWIMGSMLVVVAFLLTAFALNHLFNGTPNVTVSGIVTDAVTGNPIADARVDDNRNGADTDNAPRQAWTDATGYYELKTRYDEHTIAASAPGYSTKLSTLHTKAWGSARKVSMGFQLQPEAKAPIVAAPAEETNSLSPPKTVAQISTAVAPVTAAPAPAFQPIRIRAGSSKPLIDHEGNLWLPDQGFTDGQTIERPHLAIVNTQDPELYRSERYGMTSFSYPVPNGKYVVKLHFAETYDAITGPGERVFTFIVEGHEFKNFDVWTEVGGAQRACVETVNADVTDGVLNINFIPQQQNPQINGIEILPVSKTGVTEPPLPPKLTEKPGKPDVYQEKIVADLSTTDPFQERLNRTFPLSADGRLQLDNVNGRIEIAGWNRNELVIKALKHGKTQESVEAAKININSSPDEIVIHTELPSGDVGFFWSWLWSQGWKRQNAKVDYAIQVPQHARLKQISSVNGNITIENVSGDVEASTVNGQTQITGATGNLSLSTVNGRIEAELDSLGAGQTVSLSTVNGHIEATLPVNANAKVSASTVNGGMSSDFPALIVKKEFPLGSKLNGVLGDGGATVTASSVNGRINFRRGTD